MIQTPSGFLAETKLGLNKILMHAKKLQALQNHLTQSLPKNISNYINIINFREGILMIGSTTASALTMLKHNSPDLLAELRKIDGFQGIVSIQFKVRPKTAWAKKEKRSPDGLSEEQALQLTETAKGITHAGLKKSLERLAKNRR